MSEEKRKQAKSEFLLRDTASWMSRAVLLVVAPWTAAQDVLEFHAWLQTMPRVAWVALGVCVLLAALVWRLRAGTPGAATLGAAITGCLMLSTLQYPYRNWLRSGLTPLLVTLILTLAATRIARSRRSEHDSNEARRGRDAAQVAANLGAAALAVTLIPFAPRVVAHNPYFAALIAYAALAEAAADTVSSEIGQAFGGAPRLVTTWRRVPPGTDGAVTVKGSLAGLMAAAAVAVAGIWSLTGAVGSQGLGVALILLGAMVGWAADSLLGAVAERRSWLNNDAVNFLSTVISSAATLEMARMVAAVLRIHG